MDPNNLIWMGWKWRHGDVSRHTGGDLAAALGRITAKTMVVAFSRDMFFPPARLRGRAAADREQRVPGGGQPVGALRDVLLGPSDREQIDACIRDLLKVEID